MGIRKIWRITLGSGDVVKVLEKADRPLTSLEISELLEIGASSIRRILCTLKKDCSVDLKFRKLNFDEKKKRYGHVVNPTLISIYWLD